MEIATKLPDPQMASRLQALLALKFTDAENIPELFRQLIELADRPSEIHPVKLVFDHDRLRQPGSVTMGGQVR